MQEIKRGGSLNKLISRKENGLIKILIGIRRCRNSIPFLINRSREE